MEQPPACVPLDLESTGFSSIHGNHSSHMHGIIQWISWFIIGDMSGYRILIFEVLKSFGNKRAAGT